VRANHDGMTEHQSSRTLVKSAPELWAECSDAGSLARHLGSFGEIRITRLEPELTVAWEGTAASGTVRLEPSGWGTRVTLTVTGQTTAATPEPEPATAAVEPEPPPAAPAPAAQAPEPAADAPEPAAEAPEPAAEAAEPEVEPEVATPRVGILARLRLFLRGGSTPATGDDEAPAAHAVTAEAVEAAEAVEPAEPAAAESVEPIEPAKLAATSAGPPGELALVAALDSLGRAHHRPYSRA